MNVALLSPVFPDLGISTIAPLLKRDGHSVKLLFIPQLLQDCLKPLPKKFTQNIIDFLAEEDTIGINNFSENYRKTVNLVDNLKKSLNVPLVWGGIYATLKPQDCIKHADIVCVGEGEEAMLELLKRIENKEPLYPIRNLLLQSQWPQQKNAELRPPVNLDSLLPLDYELETHYITGNTAIRKVKESDHKGIFYSFSSRSCPFQCSYCCNATLQNMYKGQKLCRQRNIDNLIDALKNLKQRFSSCKHIWFNEADFLSGKTNEQIAYFSERYKKEVALSFSVWSHPAPINDENIKMLKDAGLTTINIGTVNASQRVQRTIYKRNAPAELYQKKGAILNKYAVATEYDFILCNPYENEDDIIETISLLMTLPKPFRTIIYILTYFQETELYAMALKDKIIPEDIQTQSYTKAAYKAWKSQDNHDYLNIVASMIRGKSRRIHFLGIGIYGMVPDFILRFLIKKSVIRFVKRLPFTSVVFRIIGNIIMLGYIASRKLSDFNRKILQFFRN